MYGLNILWLCCVCIFHHVDNGAALNGGQKDQPYVVDQHLSRPKRETTLVKAHRPRQGFCYMPIKIQDTVGLRVSFKQSGGKSKLESDCFLDGVHSNLTCVKRHKNVVQHKVSRAKNLSGIAFKVCIVGEVTVECYAKNTTGFQTGSQLKVVQGVYYPMQPKVHIETHVDGILIRNENTRIHCIGFVGTNGRLELRVAEPSPYNASRVIVEYWIVYFDGDRASSNSDMSKLAYKKGHGKYGPYIRARVEVMVKKGLHVLCYTKTSTRAAQRWKYSPPQITFPRRPHLHVSDRGRDIYLLCSNSANEYSDNANTRLFYKDVQGLLIYSKENASSEFKTSRIPNNMGQLRDLSFREVRSGVEMDLREVSTLPSFVVGCQKYGLLVCKKIERNITQLASEPPIGFKQRLYNAENLSEDETDDEQAFNLGQLALLSVGLGAVVGVVLTVIMKAVRGKP